MSYPGRISPRLQHKWGRGGHGGCHTTALRWGKVETIWTRLVSPLEAAGIRIRLAGLRDGSGDVYAWRADAAGPA